MANTERDLITTAQAAERLACSIYTVARQARNGELPYVMRLPGAKGAYLFDAAVIDNIADERLAKYRKALQAQTTG